MTHPIPGADSERAEFEAEMSKLDLSADDLKRGPGGEYVSTTIDGYYTGWKMARAAAKVGANVAADVMKLPICPPKYDFMAETIAYRRGWMDCHTAALACIDAGAPSRKRSPYVLGVKPSDWAEQVAAGAPAETTDEARANFEDWYVTHIDGAVIGSADCAARWAAWLAGSSGCYKAPYGWKIAPMPWCAPTETPKPALPFHYYGLSAEELQQLLSGCLNPEEIASDDDEKQHGRVGELVRWFVRFTQGHANPKWATRHACELAYFIAKNGINRAIDLDAITKAAFKEGVNITPEERGTLERIGFAQPALAPIAGDVEKDSARIQFLEDNDVSLGAVSVPALGDDWDDEIQVTEHSADASKVIGTGTTVREAIDAARAAMLAPGSRGMVR